MPRQVRVWIPELPLHVIQRGNDKRACFRESRDFRVYLALLDELSPLHGCEVHAYVLMTNHVHLLLTPARADSLSMLMKNLGQRFVQYVNRKYERSGALFEGRFRSCIVDSDGYLLACYRYIEMNPVRAGMVDRPGDYPWSSYRTNAEGAPSDFIVPHPLYLGLAPKSDERLSRYRSLFEVEENPGLLGQIRDALNSGRALARDSFLASLDDVSRRTVTRRPRGREAFRLREKGV